MYSPPFSQSPCALMPRKLKTVLVAGLLIVSLAACSSQKGADSGAPAGSGGTGGGAAGSGAPGGGGRGGRGGGGGPVPVVTGRVETKAVPVTIPAVGTGEALETVQIRPR